MNRGKSSIMNMISGLFQEIVAVVCGFILPRIILSYYGSEYNGLLNSITQFLGFSVILRSGLGAVTNAALYKPLADSNYNKMSGIMVATDRFMIKVGYTLICLIFVFALLYPFLVIKEFGYFFTFSLILIVGASTFVENMFSIKYKILLQADQKYYIQTITSVIAQIISTIFAVVLIQSGFGIHVARIGVLLGFLTTPVMLKLYVDKYYNIDWSVDADNVAIKSRWDAFAQQLSTIANTNVGIIVLTLFVPMLEVSVYSVYYMVVYNVTKMIQSCLNGVKSTFGNMLAKGEIKILQERFQNIEWLLFTIGTIIFTIAAIMITPFILIYTKGITDVSYDRTYFGLLMVLSAMIITFRIPYQLLVEAAGHFKQTRNGAFIELVLNILLSSVFAHLYGISGVVIGLLMASSFRTIQFVFYSSTTIVKLPVSCRFKNLFLSFFTSAFLVKLSTFFSFLECDSYLEWTFNTVAVSIMVMFTVITVNIMFSYQAFFSVMRYLLKRK